MKFTSLKLGVAAIALASLSIVSCKKEGPQGEDGEDGNANVKVVMIDSTDWVGSSMTLAVPEITQEVMDNYAVIGYAFNGTLAYPIPGAYSNGNHHIRVYMTVNNYTLNARDWDGTNTATPTNVDSVKLVFVEGEKNMTFEEHNIEVMNELHNAGVDPSNYDDVIRHYGIDKRN